MRLVLFVPLLILVALFAVSNQQEVEIRLWPFDVTWVAPLGLAVLLVAALAFLIGATIAWASGLPARRRAARVEQAARLLDAELASLRQRAEAPDRRTERGPVPEAEILPAQRLLVGSERR